MQASRAGVGGPASVWRVVVFDGDDTLWQTEWLYDEARQAARQVVEAAGLDGEAWEALERRIDVANVKRLGHASTRFPTSCVEGYEELCRAVPRDPDPQVRSRIWNAASMVFTRPAPLMDKARETLLALRARGLRLGLLTKGDPEVQRRRVDQSGLGPLFDAIEIVESKNPDVITAMLSQLGVRPDEAVSVGNSVRSDVLPSLAAGVQPVWIDAHVWEFERDHEALTDDRVIAVDSLSEVLEVIEQ